MRFEALCRPKARDLSTPPDDVLLHVPGQVTAIFDGATDARKRRVNGVPFGRAAAAAAARATATLPEEAADWPADRILAALSSAVGQSVPPDTEGGPASTTATIAFERADSIRLVGLGDTGYRINGATQGNSDLTPDRASIPARVRLFETLRGRHGADETETLSQRYIGFGLDQARRDGTLTESEVRQIIDHAIVAADLPGAEDEIARLLSDGLRRQYQFANNPDARLGYGILNGRQPLCTGALDLTINREELHTLELFSDGYLDAPTGTTVADWEAIHAAIEAADPHHLTDPQAVKGSTATHVFDDRTIAILAYADAAG